MLLIFKSSHNVSLFIVSPNHWVIDKTYPELIGSVSRALCPGDRKGLRFFNKTRFPLTWFLNGDAVWLPLTVKLTGLCDTCSQLLCCSRITCNLTLILEVSRESLRQRQGSRRNMGSAHRINPSWGMKEIRLDRKLNCDTVSTEA